MPIQRWENEGGRVPAGHEKKSATASGRAFPSRIDVPVEKRKKLIALLNQQLADTFDLYGQAKQAHWNVNGPHFHQLHGLFDELADELLGFVDLIAERATALGGMALGTVRMAAAASRLPEYPGKAVEGMEHVDALAQRFAALGATTRAKIATAEDLEDAGSADLLTEVSRGLDKGLWFLEAHLQK